MKEKERQRTCLYGCLAVVGVLVVLCTVGAYIVYTEARHPAHLLERFGVDCEVILPDGYTEEQVYRQLEGFINGVIDGTVRPQEGIIILFQLFLDLADGVLTKDEIHGILEQIHRIQGVNL